MIEPPGRLSEPDRLVLCDYDDDWPSRFEAIGAALRRRLDRQSVLRIDHIGSTAVPGLAAKDVIDVQVTVTRLADVDEWPDELLPGIARRPAVTADHVPIGLATSPAEWGKRYWSKRQAVHVHVREHGRLNQRYALLFRDYLRAEPLAASAYGQLKRALAGTVADDWDAYYAIKDPACDLIIAAAEHWAARVAWTPGDSDA